MRLMPRAASRRAILVSPSGSGRVSSFWTRSIAPCVMWLPTKFVVAPESGFSYPGATVSALPSGFCSSASYPVLAPGPMDILYLPLCAPFVQTRGYLLPYTFTGSSSSDPTPSSPSFSSSTSSRPSVPCCLYSFQALACGAPRLSLSIEGLYRVGSGASNAMARDCEDGGSCAREKTLRAFFLRLGPIGSTLYHMKKESYGIYHILRRLENFLVLSRHAIHPARHTRHMKFTGRGSLCPDGRRRDGCEGRRWIGFSFDCHNARLSTDPDCERNAPRASRSS